MENAVAPGLTAAGLVRYNGFNLSGVDLKTRHSSKVIYDDAERTQISVEMSWTFVTIVRSSDIDAALNNLSAVGGRLEISGMGFRNFDINPPGGGGVRDCNWGPKPRVIDCRIFAYGTAWELTWEVTTQIPFCPGGEPAYFKKMQSLNYEISFELDEAGLCVRTISGELVIPITRERQGDRTLPDSAESYLELIDPIVPEGFKRASKGRTLSKDRRNLRFSIVDVEIDSDFAYPEGILKIDLTEDIVNEGISLSKWSYSLSGSITVARPYPKSWAWDKFVLVMKQRLDYQKRKAAEGEGVMYITHVKFSDQIYGRRSTFSVSWLLACPLKLILKNSGIWVPIDNANWGKWRTSMYAGPWKMRGESGLTFNKSDDVIIDLCEPNPKKEKQVKRKEQKRAEPATTAIRPETDPETSWVLYKVWLEFNQENGVVRHFPLPKEKPKKLTKEEKQKQAKETKAYKPRKNDSDAIVQTRSGTQFDVYLVGYAVRVGFEITPPELTGMGGQTAVPAGQMQFSTGVQSTGDPPIYWAKWRVPYIVPNAPTAIEQPKGGPKTQ